MELKTAVGDKWLDHVGKVFVKGLSSHMKEALGSCLLYVKGSSEKVLLWDMNLYLVRRLWYSVLKNKLMCVLYKASSLRCFC